MTTRKKACTALVALLLLAACDTSKDKVADPSAADLVSEVAQDALGGQETVTDVPGSGNRVPEDEAGEPDVCQPNCQGKECGDDGCGGGCGACSESIGGEAIWECDLAGQCVLLKIAGVPCTEDAECHSGWCVETSQGLLCSVPCVEECPEGRICEKVSDSEPYNACVPCLSDCEGKECGPDGFGGSCGECEEGLACHDGLCVPQGCQPNCDGKACGDDGCGGTCGICDDGLECLNTKFGLQCTTQCELFTCPAGQFCLFGLCVDQECENDDDCGGAPAHYCDELLQCKDRKACEATDECNTWNKEGYCDQDTGFCMYDGHCWDAGDCAPGTCGPDHWCQDHNCYELYGPGCPPQLPICYMPSGEEPLCDGLPCATCVVTCIFDVDCPGGMVCRDGGQCQEPGNDCILDTDCAAGQYCHPGCVALKPPCDTEADCGEGKLCLSGFCLGDMVQECEADEECMAFAEGYSCQGGLCKPVEHCMLDSQCEEGQYCHSAVCQSIPELPECKTDAGCTAELICENEQCQAPPECYYDTQCPAGHVCEDQHCYNDDGVCAWLEKGPGFCDDDDPCTEDTCDAVTGCVHSSGACD